MLYFVVKLLSGLGWVAQWRNGQSRLSRQGNRKNNQYCNSHMTEWSVCVSMETDGSWVWNGVLLIKEMSKLSVSLHQHLCKFKWVHIVRRLAPGGLQMQTSLFPHLSFGPKCFIFFTIIIFLWLLSIFLPLRLRKLQFNPESQQILSNARLYF